MEFMELKFTASCLPGRPAGSWAQAGGQVGRACCVPLNRVDSGSGIPAPHPGMPRRTSTPPGGVLAFSELHVLFRLYAGQSGSILTKEGTSVVAGPSVIHCESTGRCCPGSPGRPPGCNLQPPGAQQFSGGAPSLCAFRGCGADQQDHSQPLERQPVSQRKSPGFQSCQWLAVSHESRLRSEFFTCPECEYKLLRKYFKEAFTREI